MEKYINKTIPFFYTLGLREILMSRVETLPTSVQIAVNYKMAQVWNLKSLDGLAFENVDNNSCLHEVLFKHASLDGE